MEQITIEQLAHIGRQMREQQKMFDRSTKSVKALAEKTRIEIQFDNMLKQVPRMAEQPKQSEIFE